ncbi:AAWKG family protein [Streptomyces griseoluteus]|uniref:AAWKG family protein n=1 Tax=Streptomyces griseoluteus TaxID=29306 RepID=UPI0036575FDC
MADRYDSQSVANIDKFDNAGDPSGDTWAALVTHITGYPVPDRNTVFDTLRSEHGGKLFRMDIKERSLGLLVKDSGFLVNSGEDYDVYFFDSGKKHSIMQARIVFEGRVKAGDEVIFASPGSDDVNSAQVREGNEFTDYNKDKMSTVALARYMNGPRSALLALLSGNTQDARFSNLGVPGADVVDLNSFGATGDSFDYAAKFFKDHAPVLKDWEDRFGRDDASWKGEAAEVFRSLLKKIRENYDSYVETFDSTPAAGEGTTGATVYSRALSLGRGYLESAASTLLDAWLAWAKSPYYDPHQVLRYVLDDLAQWVDTNNVAKTKITSYTTRYSTTVSHSPQEGFTQNHPDYGDLNDIANWAKVGDKAVKLWSQGVAEYLGKPAAQVQSDLNNHFLDLGTDFSDNVPKPKSTGTAADEYKEKKAKEEQDELNRQREEDRKYQEQLREEQNKQREEDKKYQDQIREEQNKQRDEDKKYQDQLREEQNKQRDEDKKYQDEIREEQRKEQEEAKRQAEEQTKAFTDGLGGLNGPGGPNAVTEQNLDGLGDLLNQDKPSTESLGSLGDVNGPGGNGQQLPPPLTADLGSLGGLNTGLGGSLKTPTGGSAQLRDGKLTTDFPDGSSSSFDPGSKVLTTTRPDGSKTTTDLGDGLKVTNPDGSVTSLGKDGKLTTTFPDGTKQTVDPATGQSVTTDPDGSTHTEDLGSLNGLNGGAHDGLLDTPTGGSTNLTGDGDLRTRFPDGSTSTFDPGKHTLTTTHPDGSTTTAHLGDGAKVTNPDGSVTSLGKDGKLTTTFPDGTKQTVDPATGQSVTTDPDGSTHTEDLGSLNGLNSHGGNGGLSDLGPLGDINTQSLGDLGGFDTDAAGLRSPTGSHLALDAQGDIDTAFGDGSKSSFDVNTGQLTTTGPDGTHHSVDLTHGARVTNPDGSTTVLDNGKLTNRFPDGSVEVIDPETGVTTLTDPSGHTRTLNLHDLDTSGKPLGLDLPHGTGQSTGGGGTSRDLSLSGLGGGTGGGSGGLGSVTADGFSSTGAAPLSEGGPAGGGPSAPAAHAPTPGAPGAPGSPGMPMGGAGGMGAGGDKGNGERVRAVLVDAAEESERRNRRRRSPWHRQEDSDTFLAPAGRVTTTGGESPEETAEPNRTATRSADYLEEDADVWGTEEGGTPAVIGR